MSYFLKKVANNVAIKPKQLAILHWDNISQLQIATKYNNIKKKASSIIELKQVDKRRRDSRASFAYYTHKKRLKSSGKRIAQKNR